MSSGNEHRGPDQLETTSAYLTGWWWGQSEKGDPNNSDFRFMNPCWEADTGLNV